jgi:sugar phosphate isomerase/epimerase
MDRWFTRRQFLHDSCRFAAGAGAASLWLGTAAARAAGKPLCLACRDAVLPRIADGDVWSALTAIGAEGLEAVIGGDLSLPGLFHRQRKYTAATDEGLRQVTDDMRAAGCRITALCMFNQLDVQPEKEIQWAIDVARAAQALGVKAVRIDVVPVKLPREKFLDFAVGSLKKIIAATESTGVAFAIENHGSTTNDPDFLNPLFERVGSQRLGLTLDTGNFYWYGHPLEKVYELFQTFAPRVFHTHIKSIHYPADQRERRRSLGWGYEKYTCPIFEGDIDFGRVIQILRGAGYSNDLCVEDESLSKYPLEKRSEILSREIRYLKERL